MRYENSENNEFGERNDAGERDEHPLSNHPPLGHAGSFGPGSRSPGDAATPSLTEVDRQAESALSALRPRRPRISAGAVPALAAAAALRAGRRQVWAWRGVAAALAAGLVLSFLSRPPMRTVERVVYRDRERPGPIEAITAPGTTPAPPTVASAGEARRERPAPPLLLDGEEYGAVRSRVLALGVRAIDVFPYNSTNSSFPAAGPAGPRQLPVRAMDAPAPGPGTVGVRRAPAMPKWLSPLFGGGQS